MTAADLTTNQVQILQLLLAGKTQSEIARERATTLQSVNCALIKVRAKAGVRTLFQLAAWAERHGIREATT